MIYRLRLPHAGRGRARAPARPEVGGRRAVRHAWLSLACAGFFVL